MHSEAFGRAEHHNKRQILLGLLSQAGKNPESLCSFKVHSVESHRWTCDSQQADLDEGVYSVQ